MRVYTKLFVGALAATALLVSLTAASSARIISLSNRNFRSAFNPLDFVSNSGQTIRCQMTMEGSFHSSIINKVVNSLIGFVTRATVHTSSCENSEGIRGLVRQASLPWHIRYVGFLGTLPIARIRDQIMNVGFRLLGVPLLGSCEYTGNPSFILEGPTDGSGINTGAAFTRAEEGQFHPSSTAFCPEGRFVGRAQVFLLGTVTPIIVRLI